MSWVYEGLDRAWFKWRCSSCGDYYICSSGSTPAPCNCTEINDTGWLYIRADIETGRTVWRCCHCNMTIHKIGTGPPGMICGCEGSRRKVDMGLVICDIKNCVAPVEYVVTHPGGNGRRMWVCTNHSTLPRVPVNEINSFYNELKHGKKDTVQKRKRRITL